ncbi:MAG: hypothetical protein ACTSSJ_07115 [Candidatus Odinarchaeia archaeon]
MGKKEVRKLEVDFWATGLHGAEIGIRQREQWITQSRAFTKDMDIFASFKEKGDQIGFFGVRKKLWEGEYSKGKKDELRGRLVIRLFNNNGKWLGSIEEMMVEELVNSIPVKDALPCFRVILSGYPYVIDLNKVYQRFTLSERYGFTIVTDKKTADLFELLADRVSIGSDWHVYYRNKPGKNEIAGLDSKKLNIGGKVEVKFYDGEFAENSVLERVLALFSATIKYHDKIKERIKRRIKIMHKNDWIPKLSKGELWLMRNPRRLGYAA